MVDRKLTQTRKSHGSIMLSVNESEPKPCKRYAKRMLLTAKFIAHMPSCDACKAVVAHLNKESEIKLYSYRNRN
jgi:hypothetical protein